MDSKSENGCAISQWLNRTIPIAIIFLLVFISCNKVPPTIDNESIATTTPTQPATTEVPTGSTITTTEPPTQTIPQSSPGHIIIDNFESASPLSLWSFGNGQGASGTLTITDGHVGKGGKLTYDFTGEASTEKYMWATHTMSSPVSASVITFWVKAPPGIIVKLNIRDSTGQTLQYPLTRPFGETNPERWFRYAVKLDQTPEHWGGNNDGFLHGSITAVSILAAGLRGYPSVGELLIDDFEALSDITFYLDATLENASPIPEEISVLTTRLGVNIHFPAYPSYSLDERALDLARSAGFTRVRMNLPWASIYKGNGIYDFNCYDELVKAVESREMKLIFILDQGHELFTGGWNIQPTTQSAIKAFGDFARESAKHFAGHSVVWEVWNEPNIAIFWPPTPNIGQYAALLKETIQRIYDGNPSAEVTTAGLSGYDYTFLENLLDTGAADNVSAIGIHPYGVLKPEEVSDYTLLMRAIIRGRLNITPPVWDTEWGYSSAFYGNGHSLEARNHQAVMVCRELISAWAVGFPLIIYYDIRDDGTDPIDNEHNFGLLTNDYGDKPAMQAVRTLTKFAKDRKLTGIVTSQPTSLHVLMLEGQNDVAFIVWSDLLGNQLDVVIPIKASATDYLGNPLSLTAGDKGQTLKVSESDGPVYVIIPR